jgi:hypothetical protein
MLERMRWRLTLGYAGIFAIILLFLSAAAVFGFSRELTNQQDVLLEQEAKDQAKNLLDGDDREILAEGSAEFSWVALDPDGRVTSRQRPWEPWASLPENSPKRPSRTATSSPRRFGARRAAPAS